MHSSGAAVALPHACSWGPGLVHGQRLAICSSISDGPSKLIVSHSRDTEKRRERGRSRERESKAEENTRLMKFYAFLMCRQFVLDDISIGLLVRFLIRIVSYKEMERVGRGALQLNNKSSFKNVFPQIELKIKRLLTVRSA